MNGTQESPRLGKKFSDSSCFELGEEGTSVNTAEMGEVAVKVELFSDDGVA